MTDYISFLLSEHINAYVTPGTVNVDLNRAYITIRIGKPILEQTNSTGSCKTITHCTWKIKFNY